MKKSILISVIAFSFAQLIHAQVPTLPNPPTRQNEEIMLGDDDQELEALEAASALLQKADADGDKDDSFSLQSLYLPGTLLASAPRAEILRNNIWQKSGVAYDASMGVTAYSNVKGGKWQCTELVHRFLKTVYGVPTKIGMGLGHANKVIQNLYAKFKDSTFKYKGANVKMLYHKDGVSQEPPAPGSVINFEIGKQGHTAVIRYVEVVDSNTVKAYLLEQHGYPALKAGQAHGVNAVTFNRNGDGSWSGERRLGTGKSIYWINFRSL